MNTHTYSVLLLSFALSIASTANAQSVADLDKKNGFRSAVLGDSLSHFANMRFAEDNGNVTYYRRTDEDLDAGTAKLADILYGFYNRRLSTILIFSKGSQNSHAVLAILRVMYGDGYRQTDGVEHFCWYGERVTLAYKEEDDGSATVGYGSVDLMRRKATDDSTATAKAAGKF